MKKTIIIFILTLAAACLFGTVVQAALIKTNTVNEINVNLNTVAKDQGAGYTDRSVDDIIASIFRLVISLVGVIFIVLIFVAGNNWMQAGGNEEKAKKAKDTIAALLTGLCILLVAYALTSGVGGLISKVLLK